jgi:hypothetical protein
MAFERDFGRIGAHLYRRAHPRYHAPLGKDIFIDRQLIDRQLLFAVGGRIAPVAAGIERNSPKFSRRPLQVSPK